MRLDLCSGPRKKEGYIGLDIRHWPGVDIICDLNNAWPFDNESIEEIRAKDAIEHLKDPIHTMNEIYRVLFYGGRAEIMVPSTDGRGAWQDPSHISYWNYNSFFYYSIDHPVYLELGRAYGFNGGFKVEYIEQLYGEPEILWVHVKLRKVGI